MTTAKPEVKRDRVGVLASTIVKELATARLNEIRRESVTPDEPPLVMTSQMTRLLSEFTAARKAKRKVRAAIERLGLTVENDYGDDDSKVKLARPRVGHREKEAQAKSHQERRMNRVREMRTEALIDLVTLDPAKAKQAVREFRVAIEAV